MKKLPDPVKTIFQHYFHVESFDPRGLHLDMDRPNWVLDPDLIKKQLLDIISSPRDYIDSVNKITSNEFEEEAELVEWLEEIRDEVFRRF